MPRISAMQLAFKRQYFPGRYEILCPNLFLDWSYEMDICGVRKNSGFVDETEIKVSVADFRADFKKTIKVKPEGADYGWSYLDMPKHKAIEQGILGNYFAFLVPRSIRVEIQDLVPDYAGLYVYQDGKIRTIKHAPRLHDRPIHPNDRARIMEKFMWRYWQQFNAQELQRS